MGRVINAPYNVLYTGLFTLLGSVILLAGCIESGSPGGPASATDDEMLKGAREILVNVNNHTVSFDHQPIVDGEVTYVQLLPLAEQLGLTPGGITDERFYGTFSLSKSSLNIEFELGNPVVLVDNRRVDMSGAPFLKDGSLFVPIRSLATAANYSVDYLPDRGMFRIFLSYRVVGYFTSWGDVAASDVDGSKMTHINYAFANIVNGEVALSPIGEGLTDPNPGRCNGASCAKYISDFRAFEEIKERHAHLQVLISVGGWTWSGRFSDTALTEASRAKFAESAVKFIRKYKLDGIDIDWEYPVAGGLPSNVNRAEDRENFTLLLKELREQLDRAGVEDGKYYLLTIASGANPDYLKNTELDKVADIVDFINIMTYDFHGDWETVSGHNAPLYFDPEDPHPHAERFYAAAAVNGHLNTGVPPKKLVMGIPFYERSWGGCEPENDGLYQKCEGTEVENWVVNKNGFVRHWNDRAKVPYLYKEETGQFVSYEDAESIAYKAEFIKSNGLGGAMFWAINNDHGMELLDRLAGSLIP